MSNLSDAVGDLFAGLVAEGGVTVQITIDGVTSSDLTAVPGVKLYDVELATGSVITHQSHDFIMDVTDWPTPPKRGDSINSGGKVYEVTFPGGGREYGFTDQYETLYRIHTVEVFS